MMTFYYSPVDLMPGIYAGPVVKDSLTTHSTKWTYRPAQFGPVDFRLSYLANATMDGFQTVTFPGRGLVEQNPFLSWAVNPKMISNGVFAVFSIGAVVLIDSWINDQSEPNRTIFYGIAWLIHSYTISSNARLGVKGIPLVLPVLSVRF